ncbi:MAG: restriction endonuclease [Deltaproteobacteria bacterium]|jgi:restriction endonuclease Mrr|nr:restriction endonuclease [Deltaproteobacteria bacterium]
MPIPKYNALLKPYLELLGDGAAHTLTEVGEHLTHIFSLTPEELALPSPRRTGPLFAGLLNWADAYLKMSWMIEPVGRDSAKITSHGLEVLKANPKTIDDSFLLRLQFDDGPPPDEWRELDEPQAPEVIDRTPRANLFDPALFQKSPPEAIDRGPRASLFDSTSFRKSPAAPESRLRTDDDAPAETGSSEDKEAKLLSRLAALSPEDFLGLVVFLLGELGYRRQPETPADETASEAAPRANKLAPALPGPLWSDPLGLCRFRLLARPGSEAARRSEVARFAEALADEGLSAGLFVAASSFKPLKRLQSSLAAQVTLIDGRRLVALLAERRLGLL